MDMLCSLWIKSLVSNWYWRNILNRTFLMGNTFHHWPRINSFIVANWKSDVRNPIHVVYLVCMLIFSLSKSSVRHIAYTVFGITIPKADWKLCLIRAVCAFVCQYTENIGLITSAYNFTSDFQFATMNELILGQWWKVFQFVSYVQYKRCIWKTSHFLIIGEKTSTYNMCVS
jgi:hypothetical protein